MKSWKPFVWGFRQSSVDNEVAPFDRKPLLASSFIAFLWILRKTTRILSIATRWKKNLMPVTILCIFGGASAWVVVLQRLMQTTLGWSQNVGYFSWFIERDPPILPVVKVFWFWHSIGVILFCTCTTNIFISIVFDHPFTENMISQESIVDSFVVPLYASLFSSYWPDNVLCLLAFSHICGHEVFPYWWHTKEVKESPSYI